MVQLNKITLQSTRNEITPLCIREFLKAREVQRWVREGDVISRQPSTNRIDINIDWVLPVLCDNHQLTVRMITNQGDMKKDFGGLSPKITACLKVEEHVMMSIRVFLVERNVTMQEQLSYKPDISLSILLSAQRNHQRNLFWKRSGHHEALKDGAEGLSRRILPAVLNVEEKKGESGWDSRWLVWGWPCSLSSGIEINCLWHNAHYFLKCLNFIWYVFIHQFCIAGSCTRSVFLTGLESIFSIFQDRVPTKVKEFSLLFYFPNSWMENY